MNRPANSDRSYDREPQPRRDATSRVPKRSLADLLQQRGLELDASRVPSIDVRAPTPHPFLFRRRLGQFPTSAMPGDLVRLQFPDGSPYGWGLFNPHAEISVRTLTSRPEPPATDWWRERLTLAVSLRRDLLKLDEQTTAYRVVHAEGDGLSGLIVDRFNDVLVVEAFSLGMYQRAEALLDVLSPLCGTAHGILRSAPLADEHEGFSAEPVGSEHVPAKTIVQEFGTQFKVDFTGGHKTGFYCDQRENRKRLASFCAGKTVLDVCSYTGGFAVQAMHLGGAAEVTGVELDEPSMLVARENARLNKAKVQFVQADAFPYLRDMIRNQRRYDVLVLDPPKLIFSRDDMGEGKGKYFDLNRLALQLVAPGGVFLTCSCSGLLDTFELQHLVQAAAHDLGRTIQIFDRSGAAGDHPIAGNCPEGEYLKALWIRVTR